MWEVEVGKGGSVGGGGGEGREVSVESGGGGLEMTYIRE